jgi:hypothetical protein
VVPSKLRPFASGLLLGLLATACTGSVAAPGAGSISLAGSHAAAPANNNNNADVGDAAGAAGTGSSTPAVEPTTIPARIRRLTDAEFDTSVKALLGIDSTFGASFTPDTRQDGFTRNDAQRVDPVFIGQLDAAAQQLATTAVAQVTQLAPCSDAANGGEACAKTFLQSFATRAYRRPATSREVDALMTVYHAGADGAAYVDGIQAVVQAVLESPGFLYVTELGDVPLQPKATLNDYEIASAMSYLLTGTPPDDALLQAAAANQLHDPAARSTQAQRLLATQPASAQVTRMIEEWLGIDAITQTAKDSNVYPDFAGLRDAMKQESDAFVSEVMWKSAGSVSDLLSADWTVASDPLARMYLNITDASATVTRDGDHVSLGSVARRGILDQGAFLSVYAHANETAPVLRGVALLRRVACVNIPSPTSLNINVVPPVPDPSKTTRQRFIVHTQDPACASCHTNIDALGFTFENLDGMGRERHTENNLPIDSTSQVAGGYQFDGNYTDSSGLVAAMAQSSDVRDCFARQLFRFAAANSGNTQNVEDAFMTGVNALPATSQGKFADILLAFIASDAFIARGASL